MKIKYLLLIAVAGAIITTDQVSKMYILTHFDLYQELKVIDGLFNITYLQNPGAAFGIFQDLPPAYREIFFLTMPPIAFLIILMLMRGYRDDERGPTVALSLVFGGAIGNYIDRLRFRYVVDFLDFHVGDKHWPAFNVADMAIVTGVGILLYYEWLKLREPSSTEVSSSSSPADSE